MILAQAFLTKLRHRIGRVPFAGELVGTDAEAFGSTSVAFSTDDLLDRANLVAEEIAREAKAQHLRALTRRVTFDGAETVLPADVVRLLRGRVWRKGTVAASPPRTRPWLDADDAPLGKGEQWVRCRRRPQSDPDLYGPNTEADPGFVELGDRILATVPGEHALHYIARPDRLTRAAVEADDALGWPLPSVLAPALLYGTLASAFSSEMIEPERRQEASELAAFYGARYRDDRLVTSRSGRLNRSDDRESDVE